MGPPHKVALVTGAARGIGLAIAQWFLAKGYAMAMLDIDGAALTEASGRPCSPPT